MAALHCLEFLCANVKKTEKLFVEKLGLTTIGTRGDNVALQKDRILFALKPPTCEKDRETLQRSGTICNNVVFKVPELQVAYEKASKAGAKVVKQPQTLSDSSGSIQSFTIQSPFTNVTHTIMDTSQYGGVYLPGYEPYTINRNTSVNIGSGISHVDHITYACNTGDSEMIVKWYENCLGFTQFRLGADSDELTVDCNGGGLKLLAMKYWRCAERGVKSSAKDGVKLVLVEPLPYSGEMDIIPSSLMNQTAFFSFIFGREKRIWCNSVAFFILSNLQILEIKYKRKKAIWFTRLHS